MVENGDKKIIDITKKPEVPDYGLCPFISGCTIVQVQGPVIRGANANAAQVVVMEAKCLGPRCQLWSHVIGGCSFRIRGT